MTCLTIIMLKIFHTPLIKIREYPGTTKALLEINRKRQSVIVHTYFHVSETHSATDTKSVFKYVWLIVT